DREPGLARAGRPLGEGQLVLLEGADIGVLRRVAGAHGPALAGRDLVEGGEAGGRFRLGLGKQAALEGAFLDGAVYVAGAEGRSLAGAIVEPLQHPPRQLRRLGRALDGHPVAVRDSRHVEASLQMGEVLVVLTENQTGEAIVVEGEADLGLFLDAWV